MDHRRNLHEAVILICLIFYNAVYSCRSGTRHGRICLVNSIPKVINEDHMIIDNKGSNEDQTDSNNQGIRTSSRPKRLPNIRSDDFYGLKVCNVVYHQGYNNVRNFEYNNSSILISIYDNNINA